MAPTARMPAGWWARLGLGDRVVLVTGGGKGIDRATELRFAPPMRQSLHMPRSSSDPIQPQDLVITLFGAFAVRKHDRVWSGGLVELLNEMGFSDGASRVALTRLVNRGLLERLKEGRLVYYAIAPRLKRLLVEGDRRIFRLGWEAERWDGSWTMLWHAIPETRRLERGRLARRLRFLGFGTVQDATWISPHNRERDVVALLREIGVEEHAGVLIGRPANTLALGAMIERAWDLEELASRYESFVETFRTYRSETMQKKLSDREAFLVRTGIVHAFRRFPSVDPDLPDELMVRDAPRREAAATFHEVYDRLEESGQRYFDSHVARARATNTPPEAARPTAPHGAASRAADPQRASS